MSVINPEAFEKIKTIKQDKNNYLVQVDLDSLSKPLANMLVAPYVAELIE